MSESEATVDGTPEEIRRRRLAVLLPKFMAGENLDRRDRDLVESELTARAGPQVPSGPKFELVPDLPSPKSYQARYVEYGVTYGVSDRSIKTWVARGREAKPPDFPPLDEPGRMAEWYERVMQARVPAKLVVLAKISAAPASPPPETPVVTSSIDFESLQEFSMEEQVASLRKAVGACMASLAKAFHAGDEVTIAARQKNLNAASETLRKAELTLQEMQISRGAYVLKSEVTADLSQLAKSLFAMRRAMAQRVTEQLADLPAEIRARVASAVEAVRESEDALFRAAKTAEFPVDVSHRPAA